MMNLVIASVIMLAAVQTAAANGARDTLRTCVKSAMTQAKTDKLTVDAFKTFARTQCTAQEQGFTAAMWAFDSKNKVSKKQSAEDAELQIEDIVASASDRYEFETKSAAPNPAPTPPSAPTPPPTPAATPKQ
jgi:hypothetical protein